MTSTITSTSSIDPWNMSSSNQTATTVPGTSIWIRTGILTSMILIDISAFFGNLLVICAFLRTRRLQTVTNYFIASLAFADALVAIFVLPLSIYCYQRDYSWKLGLILCDLWVSSDVLLCTSSILNLTCISVDRYMAITKPLTYTAYRSKFLARVMILLVWIVSVVITCPPIFGWRDKNRRYTVEEKFECNLNSARGYVVYSALGSFYIPGVVMIFVYIRIFMVVYDRANLIKSFHQNHASMASLKSVANGVLQPIVDGQDEKKKNEKLFSCFCFRSSMKVNQSAKKSLTHCPFNHGPAIEQKQNGYLIYRFTNPHTNKSPPLSTSSGQGKAKGSIFSRSRTKSPNKKSSTTSEELYQYQRNYLVRVSTDYQLRSDDSPCAEFQAFETSLSPLFKCRSRSFEQSTMSKIRDLNTELSHSRQLKAAAVAAATTPSTKESLQAQENGIDPFFLSDQEYDKEEFYPSPDENLPETTQSMTELTHISTKREHQKRLSNVPDRSQLPRPLRARATTNPSIMTENFALANRSPRVTQSKQSIPEPTRINRRGKAARAIQNSPSAILIENFKQQHRINRNGSLKSAHSSKSLASLCRLKNVNEPVPEPRSKFRLCGCCFPPLKSFPDNKAKTNHYPTPNQSFTNDEDDDEKISSSDTSNRTVTHAPNPTSTAKIPHVHPTGAPGDVNRRERIRFMKEQKTAKILAVVVGGFILLWLPFFIMYIIPKEIHNFAPDTVTFITWLGYFNSVINPFIYAYCSKQFRMAFWNITFGTCMKKSTALMPLSSKNKQLHQRRVNT